MSVSLSFLPAPTEPLARQIAAPSSPDYRLHWNRRDTPPLYARATEFERGQLTLTSAKAALQDAINAETTPYEKILPHVQIRKGAATQGTFRIVLGPEGATSGTPIEEMGIDYESALIYIAADYVHHRYLGEALKIPAARRPSGWVRHLIESLAIARALHANFVLRVYP